MLVVMMMMMMMPECLMLNIMYVWFAGTTNCNKSIATFDSISYFHILKDGSYHVLLNQTRKMLLNEK